jgi:hypothetical protein
LGSKTLLVLGGTPTATTANLTQYWQLSISRNGQPNNTESVRQVTYRTPGTISKLYIRITANSTVTNSTLTVRKNAIDTAMTLTIPASTSGVFEDTTNTVTVAAADKLNYKTITGNPGTMTVSIISCIFSATNDAVSRLTAGNFTTLYTANSTTAYAQLVGQVAPGTLVESTAQTQIPKNGVIKNLAVQIFSNVRTSDSTVRIRLNAADSSISTTITALSTGMFEDTTNTLNVLAGDLVNFSITTGTGAGESLSTQIMSIDYISTAAQGMLSVGQAQALVQLANETNYIQVAGNLVAGTVESEKRLKARETFAFSGLTISVTANTVTAASTLKLRKNGADGNMLVTIPTSATGFFVDNTNTDIIDAADDVNYSLSTGATGTSMVIRHIAVNDRNFTAAAKTITDPDTTISETRNRMKAVERLQP